jgi:ABC-2 type transport system permease protein
MTEPRRHRISATRLRAVARKEVIQLRRDTRSMILAFLLPVLLLILFGYAIKWDIENIQTAIVDQDHTARSREFVETLQSSGYFKIATYLDATDQIAPLLERGRAQIALVIPPDFAQKLDAGMPAELQAIVDGSDANTATIILAYVQRVVVTYSAKVVVSGMTFTPPITTQSRVWYNEDLKSRNMIVPGLIAVIMMIIAAILTSLTIAREWERGTMEQLAATPVSRAEVVIGKLLPYLAIGMIDVVISSLLGIVVFGVPLRGSPFLLLILSFFFLVGALGMGIFISAVTRSQMLATQLAMVTTFLPAYLLSGFMFAISSMPKVLQIITMIVPARYFLVVTRGIFLKGVGADVLYVQGLSMIVFSLVGLALSIRGFRKELA